MVIAEAHSLPSHKYNTVLYTSKSLNIVMSIPFVFHATEIGVDVTLSSDPLVFTFGVDSLPGSLSCANVTIDDDSEFDSNHSFIGRL